MKLDSKYFDSIRIQPRRARAQAAASGKAAPCQWRGCHRDGAYRAPKGRDREGEYYTFCREHVSAYNKSYNYFSGMSDHEVADFQRTATFGHRPTWTMGVHRQAAGAGLSGAAGLGDAHAGDPFEMLKGLRGQGHRREARTAAPRAQHKAARRHLAALNLDEYATASEIRAQFKTLVKLHHPDHNGGDRSSEERFREVIDAYNYLKQTGLC